jgi:hypothetical protein
LPDARASETRPVARLLVNFFYAHPVGHAIEALHYANGYHAADPEVEIAVALNAATPVELASFCPFVSAAYAIEQPLLEPAVPSLDHVPRDWTWVVDDGRRHQDIQLRLFPGLRDYYAASDRHLVAARGRRPAGFPPPAHRPHQPLRLVLPEEVRAAAAARLGEGEAAIAVMPAGSSDRELYPSLRSWQLILDALADAFPGVRVALVGKLARDERSSTSFGADEHAALLVHRTRPPSSFSRFAPGPSTASMSDRRIREDLDRIVAAAGELIGGTLSYEDALRDYFADLLAAHGGDASAIWSIDGVHTAYVG